MIPEARMNLPPVYAELSKKLMMEHSKLLPELWRMVCDEDEANAVNALPGTAEEIARALGRPVGDMEMLLKRLYHRGAVFDSVKDGTLYYRMPRQVVQFHDATLLWDEAPGELIDLWVRFMDEEYPQLLELVTTVKFPSFMRVIPIGETVAPASSVLSSEDAEGMVRAAKTLAVTRCVCRLSVKNCDKPMEMCLQLNRGAEYTLKRGTGRAVSVDEALAILKKAEEAGLVHMTENRAGMGNAICNCCDCCCEMLRYAKNASTKGVLAPSRYLAAVDAAVCTACGSCADICPMGAIEVAADSAAVAADACIGCGLCATVCAPGAIILQGVRPEDFIPAR